MTNAMRAVVHDGKIEPLDRLDLPEGTRLLITVVPGDEQDFWAGASQPSLDAIWDNEEDDVYGQLV